MSELTRKIRHQHHGDITISGTRNEDGDRVVLDVVKDGKVIDRDNWMHDHDDLAGRLPRFRVGHMAVIQKSHPARELRGMLVWVEQMHDTALDLKPSYTVRGVEGTVSERHLREPTDDELKQHTNGPGGREDPRTA